MLPISVCCITKNEEKNVDNCLAPLQKLGFEIIVVDTGSTDQTVTLASKYTSHIFSHTWQNDFSAARNFSISKASNDWVLIVDLDEYLEDCTLHTCLDLLDSHSASIGTITRRNACHLLSGQASVMTEQVARFFNKNLFQFEGIIHEQIVPLKPMKISYFAIPATFYHQGYDNPSLLAAKANRDLCLLQKALEADPEDPYLLYQIGKCHQTKKDYKSAAQYFNTGLSKEIDPSLVYVQDMIEAYGYCLLEQKEYEAALGLSGVYDLFCDSADFLFLMGLIYMNNALFRQAIEEFQKATDKPFSKIEGINSFLANYNIAVIYECMGDLMSAKLFYQKCGNYSPAQERLALLPPN